MDIPISRAGTELDELVRRAEAGEDVVLTRDGEPAVRLAPVPPRPKQLSEEVRAERRAALEAILVDARERLKSEPPFTLKEIDNEMYDENGLPR